MNQSIEQLSGGVKRFIPWLMLAVLIALAVKFISSQYGGPAMLYALLFGMAFNFLASDEKIADGIGFTSKGLLKTGVALLGARITISDIASLGSFTFLMVLAGVGVTIGGGWFIARRFGLSHSHAILSAGAVAICGASAALAISTVLPEDKDKERNTILTVVGVTSLSTLAMIIYPSCVQFFAMSDQAAGIFLGATIHDVAQVVGAGYMVSDPAGETATIVKLVRVACLVPVVLMLGAFSPRAEQTDAQQGTRFRALPLPGFLIVFILIVMANSFGFIPQTILLIMSGLSSWLILAAVAALGVKTSLQDLVKVGPAPLGVMVLQTLLLAGFVTSWLVLR